MKNKISNHISIAEHIVDGSLTIDSVKEFRSILRIFPNDPALHRAYADLLARKKLLRLATESYRNAATLYIESDKISQSYFETTTVTELIKIPKTSLKRICKKFPNIELGIIDLLKARSNVDDEEILRKVRQADRRAMPIKIDMQVYTGKSGHHPIVLDGYSRDVSIGGMCIVLDAGYAHVPSMYEDIKNSRIQISMTIEAMTISVSGKIVWSKEVVFEGQKSIALGIQYQNMTPKLSGLMVVFAEILKGEV